MTVRHLARLSRGSVRALAAQGAVAVVPIGAVEQHGDHLPLGTDFLLVEAVLDRALEQLGDDDTTWVRLPTMTFGHSPHHLFAAAVSLRPSTLSDVLADVLSSLSQSGFRRIVIVNGHGGNDELVRLAVKAHALKAAGTAAACSYWTLAAETTAEAAAAERPERTPGHAGWFETSLMLAAHPELVADDRPFQLSDPPPLFDRSPAPGLTVERYGEWPRVGGLTDDPAEATAEAGRLLLGRRVAGLVAALRGLDQATASAPDCDSGSGSGSGSGHRFPSTDHERGPQA